MAYFEETDDTAELLEDATELIADAAEPVEDVAEPIEDAAELIDESTELIADSTELFSETYKVAEATDEISEEVSEEALGLVQPANPIAARMMTAKIARNFFMVLFLSVCEMYSLPLFFKALHRCNEAAQKTATGESVHLLEKNAIVFNKKSQNMNYLITFQSSI